MLVKLTLISASLCAASVAAIRSGNVVADWISTSRTYEPGKPVGTALRLVLDAGWHTYWENPGESGMRISATWELPAGWTAGALEHPVPQRFTAGGLVGFGYKGTVVLPVEFTPPAGFTGPVKLKGKISWLACNDDKCVPGNADLELSLDAGAPVATAEVKLIEDALTRIPRRQEGWVHLAVEEKPGLLALSIEPRLSRPLELDGYEIFPTTPEVIDPTATIQFKKTGAGWTAEVPKSEYAASPVRELTLVLAGKTGQPPLSLTWRSK